MQKWYGTSGLVYLCKCSQNILLIHAKTESTYLQYFVMYLQSCMMSRAIFVDMRHIDSL